MSPDQSQQDVASHDSDTVSPTSPRLPPPDIVLQFEDNDGRPLRNVTLLNGRESARNSLAMSINSKERRESNVSIVSVKGKGFKRASREYRCWKCNKPVFTRTKETLTPLGWTLSVISCVLCPPFAACLIPMVKKSQNIVLHKCPICKTRLGSSSY